MVRPRKKYSGQKKEHGLTLTKYSKITLINYVHIFHIKYWIHKINNETYADILTNLYYLFKNKSFLML